ncbi:hypothetical protein D9758_013149 [Tetrapyrgos nigripes]|uniref:Heterokaryon incompatibility domain-containing protein n=1 Tax=Tetrapyrgos nigripes TaxID=182062 RepID=A0A8H5CFH0_9AGAR|nr:hypothetical protein D9758_013149 [Tetrapyrgos nigripes]
MRLLNTKTVQLKEFYADIPIYAILSHTWEAEEVSFQDIQNLEVARQKKGYTKVQKACQHALKYNFEWIWIDSCCINKDSSAELSEAINSMYQYYQNAEVCYAYLSDVSAGDERAPQDVESDFRNSRWFRRGWTLQELLAPSFVVFLDQNWMEVGTKWGLRNVVSSMTSVPVEVLVDGSNMQRASIAQRMSWAAFRQTTRTEDQAYCLMGIFGVNIPPIYGEGGAKAFMRLQQEIIKYSDDRSIFAWTASPDDAYGLYRRGLFARSPFEFGASGDVLASESEAVGEKSTYSFNNNGLHIYLPIRPDPDNIRVDPENRNGLFLAHLLCKTRRGEEHAAIYLRKMPGQWRYTRYRADSVALSPSPPSLEDIQLIVVEENAAPAPKHSSSPEKEWMSIFYLKLLPSAQDALSWVSEPAVRRATFGRVTHDEATGMIELRVGYGDAMGVKFKVNGTGEEFTFVGGVGEEDGVMYSKLGLGHYTSQETLESGFYSDLKTNYTAIRHRDRGTLVLQGGGLVSSAIQITNNRQQRIIEMSFATDGNAALVVDTDDSVRSQSEESIFTVPTSVINRSGFQIDDHLSLVSVFPPEDMDFCDEDGKIYLSVSSSSQHPFRILRYTWPSLLRYSPYYRGSDLPFAKGFALVLGFDGPDAWFDFLPADKLSLEPELTNSLWEYYCDEYHKPDTGLRRWSILSSSPDGSRSMECLTVHVEKRKELQLGTYLVDFNWRVITGEAAEEEYY